MSAKVSETTNSDYSHLLPERYPQRELFVCDVADAVLKDIVQHMEHPFYALSKKPDTEIRRYEHHGQWLEVTPSVKGLATIYDKDILIYCISQIMAQLRLNEPVSQWVRIMASDFLMFANRGTSGPEYDAVENAIDRLAGTRISTNIQTNEIEEHGNFGLIDRGQVRRQRRHEIGRKGRLLWCDIKISDWVFNAIEAHEVLTLHPDYFRLRRPLERRTYELARKHCGKQAKWSISIQKLLKKLGSRGSLKEFRRKMRDIAILDHLPDYRLTLEDDMATFINRNSMPLIVQPELMTTPLSSETYERARLAAPGLDIYLLEKEWLNAFSARPEYPDAAFVGFCRRRFEKRNVLM